jgi:integrase
MALSHEVHVWKLANRKNRRRAHGVRWSVAGNEFSRWFTARALADNHRSSLLQATRRGEAFDTETGVPESALREHRAVTWYDLACRFVDMKWPHLAAKSRMSIADALATITPVLVTTTHGMPDQEIMRAVLYTWAFNSERRATTELDEDKAAAITWISARSVKVTALDEKDRRSELIRRALDALALRMDGKPAAATTVARKRAAFHGVLNYAVELDILPANPIDKVRWKAPAVASEVDRRVVANPTQVRKLLDAVRADRPELVAYFACMYYAFLRSGEAAALTRDNCMDLPDHGWGRLVITGSTKRVAAGWTNDGSALDQRQLKHRAQDAVRVIPIPPILVAILRDHLRQFGTAPDGRLFQVIRGHRGTGGIISAKITGQVWRKARQRALTPAQVRSPLAGRPYDLPAPRGAPSYPRLSREELGRRFLGLMANLASKD